MREHEPRQTESWTEALRKPRWRWVRFFRDILLDLVLVTASLAAAIFLAFELAWPSPLASLWTPIFVPVTLVSACLLIWRGAHRINARYLGLIDVINLAFVMTVTAAGASFFARTVEGTDNAKGTLIMPVLFGFLGMATLGGIRILQRHVDWNLYRREQRGAKVRRTLIVGAGDAGEAMVREMIRSRHSEHVPIAFVDDDAAKHGTAIHGVKVVGVTSQIPYLVTEYNVDDAVIAMPSADGKTVRRIVELCDQAGCRVRVLPPASHILKPDHHIQNQVREVDIEDLLRREPVSAQAGVAASYISAETVLVTGGGGSIGSELARQIAAHSPANLVLLGKGENSIYEIEQELIQTSGFAPTCVIADVRDREAMEAVFQKLRPTVVFHAAAHKHVPLMQNNCIEAIKNNVFATELVAELAAKYGARKFVYISTDKAVRPTSVMGATKRVGEMIVRLVAQRSETEFAIVRFGNVLGSRGSLIPMLKRQIQRGGPLRLTHPEMTRYFMTIPEAVQLILQAGAMGRHAELFILDMGEPVKIVDLARDLVRLHGLVPGEDIEITFTGVRPGEKTHEELVYANEKLDPTQHPKIRIVQQPGTLNAEWLGHELDGLRKLTQSGNTEELRQALMELAWGKSAVPFQFAVTETVETEAGTPASPEN